MTGFIVDMARSVKVDKLSTRVHVVLLSTSRAVASAALQVGYKQLKHKQNKAVKEFVSMNLPMGSSKSLCYAMLPAAVNIRSPLRTALR